MSYILSLYSLSNALKVLPDGEKIYYIGDQNGSTRAVAKEGADCGRQYYDYSPFGDVITSLDPNKPGEGFTASKTHREMEYSILGARIYDDKRKD